jgi:predicted transcriptional regulator
MQSELAMRMSKLEFYEDIIYTLAKKAQTIDGIAFECNTSCVLVQERLEFLVRNDIVLEASRDNRVFYVLTRRGMAIFKTLVIAKRLEKLQTTPQNSAKAMPAVSSFRERNDEKAKNTR